MQDSKSPMNELGFYTLAGAPQSPRELIAEVKDAEAMGIGACFISERFNIKEAATLSGAVGAISERIGIATAATSPASAMATDTSIALVAAVLRKFSFVRASVVYLRHFGGLFVPCCCCCR